MSPSKDAPAGQYPSMLEWTAGALSSLLGASSNCTIFDDVTRGAHGSADPPLKLTKIS
jgi:hypothetical protein